VMVTAKQPATPNPSMRAKARRKRAKESSNWVSLSKPCQIEGRTLSPLDMRKDMWNNGRRLCENACSKRVQQFAVSLNVISDSHYCHFCLFPTNSTLTPPSLPSNKSTKRIWKIIAKPIDVAFQCVTEWAQSLPTANASWKRRERMRALRRSAPDGYHIRRHYHCQMEQRVHKQSQRNISLPLILTRNQLV
jgi:hypothetical protein